METAPQDFAAYVPYAALAIFIVSVVSFWNTLGKWSKSEGAMESPMSITLKTEKTPAQVARAAREARRARRVYLMLLLVGGWIVLFLFDETLALEIWQALLTVLRQTLLALVDLLAYVAQQMSGDSSVQ